MEKLSVIIGTHHIELSIDSVDFRDFIQNNYRLIDESKVSPDLHLTIKQGYGTSFVDYHVAVTRIEGKVLYRRADYLLEIDSTFKYAIIEAHDGFALKHAMTNLYSAFIVHHNWGLLIHSSCVIEAGRAHIFSGHSGAGKSTAAKLSQPRQLLSDEATLVRITPTEISVYDSPFRSELISDGKKEYCPLASIQLLHQSLENKRVPIHKPDALIQLMDKVFYWGNSPQEMKSILHLLKTLVDEIPTYELHFKKDNTFWELIS